MGIILYLNTVYIITSTTPSTNQQIVNGVTVTYATTFEILTDNQIGLLGYAKPYQSINNYLNNNISKVNNSSSSYISEYVNLNQVRNIYITSGNLGSYNTMSVSGERGIIK